MNPSIVAAIAYGILAIVGGIIGYAKAGSKVSLMSGGLSGILLIIASIMQLQGKTWGVYLAALIATILVVVFVIRFSKSRKFMPAGLMVISGVAALVVMLGT
ncbi:MAG: hypothetical protein F6K19_21275 [Cyanothece sp. SIO1E1]|nr:hypothetical protein [Cyanothece sp. SIO1E1]